MENVSYSRYRQYYQQLEPIFKKPHVRAYTMVVLSFFTLSFFGAFAIRPAVKEIFELNRKIADRRLVNQKLDEKIKNLRLAEVEYKKIQADLPIILATLPQESNFPPFLKSLEETASSSAISLTTLKFQDVPLFGASKKETATSSGDLLNPQSLAFNISGLGSYPNLLSFSGGLEKGGRLVNINDLNLGSERTGTTSAELRITVKAYAYFFPNKISEEASD